MEPKSYGAAKKAGEASSGRIVKRLGSVACIACAGTLLVAGLPASAFGAQAVRALSTEDIPAIRPVDFSDTAERDDEGAKNINDSDVTVDFGNMLYVWNGKRAPVKVKVTVKNEEGPSKTLRKGTDYRVSYQQVYYRGSKIHTWKNLSDAPKAVGYYRVVVTGMGAYEGTKSSTFVLTPPSGPSIKKLSAGKRSFTITWKKQPVQTSGYHVWYGTKAASRDGAKFKHVYVRGSNKTSATVKKLKSGKKYYVYLSSFKSVKGNRISGNTLYGQTVEVK